MDDVNASHLSCEKLAAADLPARLGYPALAAAMEPHPAEASISIGHNEWRRAAIALSYGKEQLCVEDQFAKAIIALGISSPEAAGLARTGIDNALIAFQFRGLPAGSNLSGTDLIAAANNMADAFEAIAHCHNLLMGSRKSLGSGASTRADQLAQFHTCIMGAIADGILPTALRGRFSEGNIADVMPTTGPGLHDWSDPWSGNFSVVARQIRLAATAFDSSELALSTRQIDPSLVDFVHRLGKIYEQHTGKKPRADDPKPNQPSNWHSPFSRFFRTVWPLTPQGSHEIVAPTDKQLRSSLTATPTF